MNPLNRKMFRQPGMSRQPMGILASSPQLANVVRRRMNQPVQMAHGGYHPPRSPMGRVSTSRRPVPGSVRIPLIDLLPKSGFARPALDRFMAAAGDDIPSTGIGAIRGKVQQDALTDLAMQSIRRGGSPFGDDDGSNQMSDSQRMAANRANLAAFRSAQGLGQGANIPMTAASVPAEPMSDAERMAANRANLAALRSAQGLGQGANVPIDSPVDGGIATVVDDSVRQNQNIANLRDLRSRIAAGQGRQTDSIPDPTLNPDLDIATGTAMLQDDPDLRPRFGSVPETAAEQIANAAGPRPVSTIVDENLDPGARAEAEAAAREEIAAANVDKGEQQGLVGTEGDASEKKGKKTNVELAIDLAEGYERADADASKTVVGAKTSEAANDAIASALQTQNSPDASDKDKADATDAAVGIKGTRKERVKARQALLKELLGEDQAKDIRGDAGYNLMMVGLMMAAGESPDALTNFANAAAKGLQNFATVRAERSEAKRKEDRAIALKAIDEVGAEISEEEKRAYDNQVRADSRRHDIALQEQRDVAALQRLDRQLTSAEQRQVDEFNFKRELNSRTFRQNIATLGIKAENAENLQRLQNDFSRELQTLKNQEDSAAIKTARAIQAANPELYPTLADAYAATQSSTKATDEQQRYNRLVASGMQPSQAIIFAQAGVTSEMFKQLGPEEAQERIGGLMGGGQTTAPATVTISDLPQSQQDKILAFEVGAPITTKQGTYIRTNAGTLVPVAR